MQTDLLPNVVILGDSNTWAFAPAFRRYLEGQGWPSDQIVARFKSGSSPQHWLPPGHRRHRGAKGKLWTNRGGQPSLEDSISPATVLVIIGLGGNMGTRPSDRANVEALLEVIEQRAPRARLLWRGPPPATAMKNGKLATKARKAGRYRKNAVLKDVLKGARFRVIKRATAMRSRRMYLDMMALHAGGPARGRPLATGRPRDREFEAEVLATLAQDPLASGEQVPRGPWTSFVLARDNAINSHVPRSAAADFVEIIAELGALDVPKIPAPTPLVSRVVDDRAIVRGGPPSFRRTSEVLARGRQVLLTKWEGRYGHLLGMDGDDLGWTHRANLRIKLA